MGKRMERWTGRMRGLAPLLGILALLGASGPACNTMNVRYDYEPGANYSSFHTFDWMAPKAARTEGEDNPILDRRVRQAVEKELAARGFRPERTASPDFLVTCRPLWRNRHVYTSQSMGWGGRHAGFRTRMGEVHTWKEGSLILEIVDTRTRELVWRAVGEGALTDLGSPEDAEEQVARAVRRMLERFPPTRSNG